MLHAGKRKLEIIARLHSVGNLLQQYSAVVPWSAGPRRLSPSEDSQRWELYLEELRLRDELNTIG